MIAVPDHIFTKTFMVWVLETAIRNALKQVPVDISGTLAQDFIEEAAPDLHVWLETHVADRYKAVASSLAIYLIFDEPRDEMLFKLTFC